MKKARKHTADILKTIKANRAFIEDPAGIFRGNKYFRTGSENKGINDRKKYM